MRGDSQWVVHAELRVNIMPFVHVCDNKDGQLIALLHRRQVIELVRRLMLANTVHMCAYVCLHRCSCTIFIYRLSLLLLLNYSITEQVHRDVVRALRPMNDRLDDIYVTRFDLTTCVHLSSHYTMGLWNSECGPVCLLSLHRFSIQIRFFVWPVVNLSCVCKHIYELISMCDYRGLWFIAIRKLNIFIFGVQPAAVGTEVSHWNSRHIIYAPSFTKLLSACVYLAVEEAKWQMKILAEITIYLSFFAKKKKIKVKRNSVYRSGTLRWRSNLPSHTDIPCSTFCCFRDYIAIVCSSGMLFGACNKRMCARCVCKRTRRRSVKPKWKMKKNETKRKMKSMCNECAIKLWSP